MSEWPHDTWSQPATTPGLRLVPDLPRPVGDRFLAPESALDQEMVVRRRVPVTHDVVTFVLEPTIPGTLSFLPGQFVTLVVDVDGSSVERCYTISSPPTRPHLLTITVKRIKGGALSPHLHDRLSPGDRVGVRGPCGDFSIAAHPANRYLLLSAGSGITPSLSTVRAMADLAELDDVVVVHSARTPADLACGNELDALATTHPGLRVVWVCENDSPASVPWTGQRGRLDARLLASQVPDIAEREVFTCGPPGYMAATRQVLAELHVDSGRCHEESFTIGDRGGPTPDLAVLLTEVVEPTEEAAPTVTFGRSGRSVACPLGMTVLEAATSAGVPLPSSCGGGLCGTCKSGLLAGRVAMFHQGGIRPREIAAGKFLPCCSTPDGDIVVDA
ncbi:FAD-binding oxidoreductase [Aeromicrobium sp. CF3.5]|uniref:FAD-binding oxidoreductase n=1 Tax=Aeromicrobium sp. CF3.5 TaxID=3373078 RepID=UPI003EE647CF